MRKSLHLLIVITFFSIKFEEPIQWGKGWYMWKFKQVPRKIPTFIYVVLTAPIFWLVMGIPQWWVDVKSTFKSVGYSSFSFTLPEGRKPSKIDAYRKL